MVSLTAASQTMRRGLASSRIRPSSRDVSERIERYDLRTGRVCRKRADADVESVAEYECDALAAGAEFDEFVRERSRPAAR